MRKPLSTSTLATALTLGALALSPAVLAQSTQQDLTDTRQESQIWTSYALSPYLRNSDLKVSVHDGQATLTGHVEDSIDSDLAKQIALGVVGVNQVDNQIIIDTNYVAPVMPADGYGERFDDASTDAVIRSKIIWSRFTDSLYLTVDSHHGVVTLKGSATSQNAKEAAGRIALNTRDVTAVDNQLVVDTTRPTLSEAVSGSAQEVGRELADGWITTKVRSTFLYSRNVDGYEIGINTRGGVVTLKGRLDSGVQRALVIELAKNVRGVRSVDSSGLTI